MFFFLKHGVQFHSSCSSRICGCRISKIWIQYIHDYYGHWARDKKRQLSGKGNCTRICHWKIILKANKEMAWRFHGMDQAED